ncbi:MAG TPA: hypothetical protein VFI61_00250 [Patescibacteria group bacterium]|nr:hypothetical protein [Patescibacteria group bacterium]
MNLHNKSIIFLTLGIVFVIFFFVFKNPFLISGFYLNQKVSSCKSKNDQKCYVDLVMNVFKTDGLDRALDLVSNIYSQDPSFSSTCHDVGHLLGSETYKLFKAGKPFKVTPKIAFCSYGFYHGFMESLASEGDVKKAQDFCKYIDAQISKETPDASLQCYHGIGHGWVNIHGDKSLLGDDLGIVKKGLSLCEKVAGTDSELSRCATGVFNGISIFYENGEYDLKIKKTDPMWLCKIMDKKFQDPCYISMNTVLYSITGKNLKLAARYIEEIKDNSIAQHAMINLALPFSLAEANNSDHIQSIATCRGLQTRLIIPCLQGFAFAFLEHGEPNKEYIKAIGFCKNNGLTNTETTGCLSYIYSYLAQWYPNDKAVAICNSEGVYKDFCNHELDVATRGLTNQ